MSAAHTVTLYGLSTCIHCRHARDFLEKKGVPFEMHYLDLLDGEERASLLLVVRQFNPDVSFPTIVIDNSKAIVGFQPEKLSRDLDL